MWLPYHFMAVFDKISPIRHFGASNDTAVAWRAIIFSNRRIIGYVRASCVVRLSQ